MAGRSGAPKKRLSSQLFQQVALFQGQPDGRAQGHGDNHRDDGVYPRGDSLCGHGEEHRTQGAAQQHTLDKALAQVQHQIAGCSQHSARDIPKQSLKQLQNSFDADIDFIPYRGDFPRGIFTTIVVKTKVALVEAYAPTRGSLLRNAGI